MKHQVTNEIACIMWVNEEGITQTEMRCYPQDDPDVQLRGMPIVDASDLEPMARKFREDNPGFKTVRIQTVVTTDYFLD